MSTDIHNKRIEKEKIMKKRVLSLILVCAMTLSLAACGSKSNESESEDSSKATENEIEDTTITWAKDNSGNVFLAIAEEQGWFEEQGITIEEAPIDANADAIAALSANQVDILTNYGTTNPLQAIASGEDYLIIGGYMATGCMTCVAKKGTVWNGVQDFVGKKVAGNPNDYTYTGELLKLGYDPLNDVEWVSSENYSDALAAVVSGEVDYALLGTSRNYEVSQNDDVEIMTYKSDVKPWYSCCRMVVQKDYAEKNPNTVKAIIKTLLRGQQYYESHHDECVDLMAEYMGVEKDYVSIYMNNEHFRVHCDPLKHAVVDAWNTLDETGFLTDEAKEINIEDYIAIDLYKEALDEAYEEYYDEDPEFWDGMIEFYKEHNL